mgnify:CR=1 FL=1
MIKHGMCGTTTYGVWKTMKHRCLNPKAEHYDRYGGRGIAVCDEWLTFDNFYADMGDQPAGMQIDRENNDGNYEPENCRWVTREVNMRNCTTTRLNTEAVKVIKYALKYMNFTSKRLAELHGVTYGAIDAIKYGKTWKDVTI